jgi:hypothetical protein
VFDEHWCRSKPGNRCGARKGKQLFENLVLGRLGGEVAAATDSGRALP